MRKYSKSSPHYCHHQESRTNLISFYEYESTLTLEHTYEVLENNGSKRIEEMQEKWSVVAYFGMLSSKYSVGALSYAVQGRCVRCPIFPDVLISTFSCIFIGPNGDYILSKGHGSRESVIFHYFLVY